MSDVSISNSSTKPGLAWLSEDGNLVLELAVEDPRSTNERQFFEYPVGDEMYDRILKVIGPLSVGENRTLADDLIVAIFANQV